MGYSVSVIMSIYNESEKYIEESVTSIINQSFKDFEFIIIIDNPERKYLLEFLNRFNDDRLKYFVNENNIGLALSMNKAIKLSTTKILARMDADDIAKHNRLEKELKKIEQGYDFVFSRYNTIDEMSFLINLEDTKNQAVYNESNIQALLAYKNIIHHPTVMMKKSIVQKVGGYRNFPCSQDYDLWLRLNEVNCKFYMLEDYLISYRINPNSISTKKWYQQQLTLYYIFNLSIERLKYGKDSYSYDNYIKYLEHRDYKNVSKATQLRKAINLLNEVSRLKANNSYLRAYLLQIFTILTSKDLLGHYWNVAYKKKLDK